MYKRKRPYRKRRAYRRKRVKRRKQRVPRNVISLAAGRLPPRAIVKHRYSRQVRMDEPYLLSPVTKSVGSVFEPLSLIASCNSMQGIINELGNPGLNPASSPAFLPDSTDPTVPASGVFWDRNTLPNLYQYLQRMYLQYTVIGSKIRVSYKPNGTQRPPDGPSTLTFVLLRKGNPLVFGSTAGSTTYASNYLPSTAIDQPGSKNYDWTPVNNLSGRGVSMSMGFSAKRDFGKARGNITGEDNLQSQANSVTIGQSSQLVSGFPTEQSYWHFMVMPAVTDGSIDTYLPAGTFNIDIEYTAIWTERATLIES